MPKMSPSGFQAVERIRRHHTNRYLLGQTILVKTCRILQRKASSPEVAELDELETLSAQKKQNLLWTAVSRSVGTYRYVTKT